ncbi:ABC transporter ATP-binding protein [Rubricoccus marinus]|uniref:ABC transporter ATP-binding protein n=1 Tax=Rubricoccus marinus TaxID=716817 RepID=UPI000B9924FE|nr:ABC transporter ATP-binding protein [Rubricoccus marinus]
MEGFTRPSAVLAIQTRGLAKTYSGRPPVVALRPLDLDVQPGEIFGLLGPNGAGKTTLVKLLLGIVHPTEGEASMFGTSVTEPLARKPVGFLPENHRFPDYLTARQTLDLFARMAGADSARAPALLEKVRLAGAADRKVKTFSKGMMQRLGIAQALMAGPKLVFLDEPTDGVDPVGRREIRDLLLELAAEGVTLFLNSHLLSEIERVCTRVAIMKEGEIVRDGTVEALTQTGRLWRLRATPIPESVAHTIGGTLQPDPAPILSPEASAAAASGETPLRGYTLAAPDRAALNTALDAMRASGVEIEAVEPLRQSLEDLFVEVVSEPSGAPVADSL